jgi:hypothetical protein
MPASIRINGTDLTLVHKADMWISQATMPDVCKTPTPGGPVPIPYPNIAQSSTLADGTTTVKGDSASAAIKGSKFSLSNGDEAGTVGGVKSNVFIKEATWLLYSFDVKLDGKNACRLTDKMFHNQENTVNAMGVKGPSQTTKDLELKCGEHGSYKTLLKKTAGGTLDRDHVPAKRTLFERALTLIGEDIKPPAVDALKTAIAANAWTVAIPQPIHKDFSKTYRQTIEKAKEDAAGDLQDIAKRDIKAIQEGMNDPECAKAYEEATKDAKERTNEDYNSFLDGIINDLKKKGFKL